MIRVLRGCEDIRCEAVAVFDQCQPGEDWAAQDWYLRQTSPGQDSIDLLQLYSTDQTSTPPPRPL